MNEMSRFGAMMAAFAAAAVCLALMAVSTTAAVVPHPSAGRLPGFPVIRGVIPVLGSKTDLRAREKLVTEAFAAARARHSNGTNGVPVPNEGPMPRCLEKLEEERTFFTQDMCYRGGPVLHGPTIHLIFWQGPATPEVSPFTAEYVEIVERYFEGIAHDSGLMTNTFAVDPQYWEEQSAKTFSPGEYKLSFEKAIDVKIDENTVFPTHPTTEACEDASEYSKGPCLLDTDLQNEVTKVAKEKSWPLENLNDVYVVLTPKGVGGCFEHESAECAYRQYCAYHSDFGGNGMTAGFQTVYADLPYLGKVVGCDSGVHPNEAFSAVEEEKAAKEGKLLDNGADAVIDTASHELNEAITDPIGSQCDKEEVAGKPVIVGCELNGWTDAIGQEVGDKCLPPEVPLAGIYGEPLGEVIAEKPARSYNQVVNGDRYWTQREWSNEAGLAEGACVQRAIGASFAVSAGPKATVPMTLDGSASGAPGDPAVYWVWNFGGGEQIGTASPTLSHTFATAGAKKVGLTAYDAYGNSAATVEEVNVGAAPTPPSPPAPVVIKEVTKEVIKEVIVPGRLTSAQVAEKLGLPAEGKKFSGNGPFALGHAGCPPACGVTLQLYAKVATTSHKHRTTTLVLVGTAQVTVAAKSLKTLSLSLNGKGKQLLRKLHTLPCRLLVTVEGQEGGSWQIVRSLTLRR